MERTTLGVLYVRLLYLIFVCSLRSRSSSSAIPSLARLNSRSPLPRPLAISGSFSPPKKKTAISRMSMISCTPKPNIHPPEHRFLSAILHVHKHYPCNKKEDFHLARSARTYPHRFLRESIPLHHAPDMGACAQCL